MAITLAQAKVGMADKVDQAVIDEFRRGSYLLDRLVFDNAVSPGTGGSTLTYGYVKLTTPSTAAFRALNNEYTPGEALRTKATADCKIFGGSFTLDRVIIDTSGAVDELDFQMQEKIKGAINLFHYTVINGDSSAAGHSNEFDGLSKLLTGSATEVTSSADLSTSAAMDSGYNAFLDELNEFVSKLDGKPDMFLVNSKMATKMKNIARRAGYYSRSEDAFGRSIDMWDNIPIIDLENYYDGSSTVPCVPIDSTTGKTDIYAVQIGINGFHGISPTGNNVISTHLPDLNQPGVLKTGDVEMVAGIVLKNSLKAGVLRGVRVEADQTPDATLAALTIGSLTLSPAFDGAKTVYTAATTDATNKITATPTDSDATVVIKNGTTTVTSGQSASWSAGANIVTITVTNGTEEKAYVVTVTKS